MTDARRSTRLRVTPSAHASKFIFDIRSAISGMADNGARYRTYPCETLLQETTTTAKSPVRGRVYPDSAEATLFADFERTCK